MPVKTLIEEWFPIETVGCESMRERGVSSALPPPLLPPRLVGASATTVGEPRATMLASVLPAWTSGWPSRLQARFPTRKSYEDWFVELCGIYGDPVEGRRKILWANARGIKLKEPPYPHKRAFTVNPTPSQLETLRELLDYDLGQDAPVLAGSVCWRWFDTVRGSAVWVRYPRERTESGRRHDPAGNTRLPF